MPFTGIDGPGRAILEAGWPIQCCNLIDARPQVRVPVERLHGPGSITIGDIKQVILSSLVSSDGLIGGAPCPDFSTLGSGAGIEGSRGSLFFEQLKMVKELASRTDRPLKWVLMENVKGLLVHRHNGCPFNTICEWWDEHMIQTWMPLMYFCVDARDCSLPQSRTRVWVYAFSRMFAATVGGNLPTPRVHPRVCVCDFLEPPNELEQRTMTFDNIITIQEHIDKVDSMQATDLCIVNADRKSDNSFGSHLGVGFSPILTTGNRYLVVIKPTAVTSDKVLKFGRFITLRERCHISGVLPESIIDTASFSQCVLSLGNMIPVNMAGCVMFEMCKLWACYDATLIGTVPRPLTAIECCAPVNTMRVKRARV